MYKTGIFWLTLLMLIPAGARAARPMITDDARIVDPKSCQLETWARLNRNSTEYWALPGCNFTGNLELTYGGAITREDGASSQTDSVLQIKTVLRPLTSNNYGVALAVGHARHPTSDTDANLIGDAYFYVPVSFSMADDRFVLHVNPGMIHDRAEGNNKLTWGIGSETRLSSSLQLIAEAYGDNRSRPFHQLGLRYWIVPERVQLDATYGNRFAGNGEEHWLSFGLRLLSTPFLP